MAVLRIVPDMAVGDPSKAHAFYSGLLGLDCQMDMGWVATFGADTASNPQITFASEGGSGTPVPALSIEVDDFEGTLTRLRTAGPAPTYGPVDEPWGVRRFFVEDPFGNLLNILTHLPDDP